MIEGLIFFALLFTYWLYSFGMKHVKKIRILKHNCNNEPYYEEEIIEDIKFN